MALHQEMEDGDTKLVLFIDPNEDVEGHGMETYVKFRFDLSKDQLAMLGEAAERIPYDEQFDSFDEWIEAVIGDAENNPKWFDKPGCWEFWAPAPCMIVEV